MVPCPLLNSRAGTKERQKLATQIPRNNSNPFEILSEFLNYNYAFFAFHLLLKSWSTCRVQAGYGKQVTHFLHFPNLQNGDLFSVNVQLVYCLSPCGPGARWGIRVSVVPGAALPREVTGMPTSLSWGAVSLYRCSCREVVFVSCALLMLWPGPALPVRAGMPLISSHGWHSSDCPSPQ